MKLKTTLSLLALASCAALSTQALADDLIIKGNISPVSCTPSMSGGSLSGNTLTLPNALMSSLSSAGATAGETTFAFSASGCTTSGITNMWVHFSGANVDGNGRLTPTSGSSNVRFELLNGSGGTPIVASAAAVSGNVAPGPGQGTSEAFTGTPGNMSASKTYAVQYRAEQALTASDVGAIQTAVTYNIIYH